VNAGASGVNETAPLFKLSPLADGGTNSLTSLGILNADGTNVVAPTDNPL
tara:strand:- start:528 stop:677 length:150 start_codon:yes stop_codon:yes gene_type:complete